VFGGAGGVRYATFPLLRLLTLHCTRRTGVAKGGGAQQRGRGAVDSYLRLALG